MATSNQGTWQNMQSKLAAMGYNVQATIGEPYAPPEGMTACIIPMGGRVDETTLIGPREIHQVSIRFYAPMLEQPQENIEFDLDQARANIQSDIFGDFDLGGNVAYALPALFTWAYGYQDVSHVNFRLLDLNVFYRVDDRATFAA